MTELELLIEVWEDDGGTIRDAFGSGAHLGNPDQLQITNAAGEITGGFDYDGTGFGNCKFMNFRSVAK